MCHAKDQKDDLTTYYLLKISTDLDGSPPRSPAPCQPSVKFLAEWDCSRRDGASIRHDIDDARFNPIEFPAHEGDHIRERQNQQEQPDTDR
jgi:hypothetical protein